jgi:hypothetical protein
LRARTAVVVLVVVLAFYVVLVGSRGVLLVRDGRPELVLLGLGVLMLPLVGVWLVVKELQFGRATERLAAQLGEGGLPCGDLPRRPSGRVERAAADAVFTQRKAEVEAAPEDWRGWFRLAVAYDDAGDRSRGRRAMRRAIDVHARHAGRL